jgi:two-component sensor histidine kinase
LHGLMPKEKDRQLRITFSGEGNQLYCEVWDNGIGRAEAMKISERKNKMFDSKGMNFITERLRVLSTINEVKSEVTIIDRMENEKSVGTSVKLSFEYA